MFILDTNVISELRKAKVGKANKNVTSWAENIPVSHLYLSAITILELELGVLLVERRDQAQGNLLRIWLNDQVLPAFVNRVLSVDSVVTQCCAKLHVPDPRSERDALIAATGLVHGMTIVTRNEADFALTGVPIVNPW
jgi:predicted nucleic acid-binding protein